MVLRKRLLQLGGEYIISMGLGGPLGIDMAGEKGGLVANVNYLSRRYKNNWEPKNN